MSHFLLYWFLMENENLQNKPKRKPEKPIMNAFEVNLLGEQKDIKMK